MPGLGEVVIESNAPVVNFLNEQLVKLKENTVKVCSAASQDDIMDNFECIHFIELDLDYIMDNLKKAASFYVVTQALSE